MPYTFFDKIENNISIAGRVIKTLPSRFLFGNLQTLSNNIIPIINKNVNFKSENEIVQNGFKKNKLKCDYELIEKIQKKYNLIIEDDKKSVLTSSKKKRMIIDPLKYIPEIKLLLPFVNSELTDYYNNGFSIEQVRAWRIYSDDMYYYKKQNYIYSNIWHFDKFQVDKLNIFILLNNNVNIETGATRILDIKTTRDLIRSFKFIDTSTDKRKMDELIIKKNM